MRGSENGVMRMRGLSEQWGRGVKYDEMPSDYEDHEHVGVMQMREVM
jgi:hypothetical protein